MVHSPLASLREERPSWLRVRAPTGERYQELHRLIREERLHTVCSSASCPNMGECWERGTATFMILGNICTRACRFCDVNSYSRPKPVDLDEPKRLADTVEKMGLRHAVITSVTRDDLRDGGAGHFRNCLEAIHERCPHTSLEILTPDFQNEAAHIDEVLVDFLQIFNHNLETTRRLTPKIRSGGKYERSLAVLAYVKKQKPELKTKSGLMLGLGEETEEIKSSIRDVREQGVDILTLGQYLRPSAWHHPVMRYAAPQEFEELKSYALSLGFAHVESGPLVRSSYHAEAALPEPFVPQAYSYQPQRESSNDPVISR